MAAKDKSESEQEIVETEVVAETETTFEYPGEKYSDAWIKLPPEWLGEHAIRRDEAIALAAKHKSMEITACAIALSVVDSFGGIPGIDGKDSKYWKLEKVPLPVISWLSDIVVASLTDAYTVPKNS